jgi:hypothetical protein
VAVEQEGLVSSPTRWALIRRIKPRMHIKRNSWEDNDLHNWVEVLNREGPGVSLNKGLGARSLNLVALYKKILLCSLQLVYLIDDIGIRIVEAQTV